MSEIQSSQEVAGTSPISQPLQVSNETKQKLITVIALHDFKSVDEPQQIEIVNNTTDNTMLKKYKVLAGEGTPLREAIETQQINLVREVKKTNEYQILYRYKDDTKEGSPLREAIETQQIKLVSKITDYDLLVIHKENATPGGALRDAIDRKQIRLVMETTDYDILEERKGKNTSPPILNAIITQQIKLVPTISDLTKLKTYRNSADVHLNWRRLIFPLEQQMLVVLGPILPTAAYQDLTEHKNYSRTGRELRQAIERQQIEIVKTINNYNELNKLIDWTSVKKEPDLRQAIENQLLSSINKRDIILTDENKETIIKRLWGDYTIVNSEITTAFINYFKWLYDKTQQEETKKM